MRRALGPDGRTAGSYTSNPLLNSIIYEVEFSNGQVKEYATNVLAENMLSQVDLEGYSTTILDGIIDFKKDESVVNKADRFLITKNGRR